MYSRKRLSVRIGLLLCLVILLAPALVAAQEDDVDYLALASRLISDGHYERARSALAEVDETADDHDRVRYRTLQGLVALRSGEAERAVDYLRTAREQHADRETSEGNDGEREARATRQRIALYLGQALFETEAFEESLEALEQSGEFGDGIASVHMLRAQAHWELGHREKAFTALDRGAERFADDARFMRRKVFYLVDMGFYREAAALGRQYLARAEPGPEDYLAIGSGLRRSNQPKEALTILERARLSYPRHRDIGLALARVYLDQDRTGLAADILSDLARHHPDLLPEAAELQQEAGRLHRALLLNTAVSDQTKKYRQRLSLMIAMERWEMAAGMEEALTRNGLLDDDAIRYALAYALFKAGRYDRADETLAGISGGEDFRRATDLRQAMEQCRASPWQCL